MRRSGRQPRAMVLIPLDDLHPGKGIKALANSKVVSWGHGTFSLISKIWLFARSGISNISICNVIIWLSYNNLLFYKWMNLYTIQLHKPNPAAITRPYSQIWIGKISQIFKNIDGIIIRIKTVTYAVLVYNSHKIVLK
jgi:hypothetical protein